jgi:hypothetical protein
VISVLLRAEFPRPAKVNLDVKFIDHGGAVPALLGLAVPRGEIASA